jgi:hypothetical protein
MLMRNDVSHYLFNLLWNGFAACASFKRQCWTLHYPAAGCFGNCKISILSGLSQGNQEDGGNLSRIAKAIVTIKHCLLFVKVKLDAPTVAFGVFKRALHLFPQDFREHRTAHGLRAGLGNVRRPVPAGEYPLQRLFHPIRFQ